MNIYTTNMKSKVAIIIPTYNNYQYLSSCLNSILSVDFVSNFSHIYVVNNGHKNSCDFIGDNKKITVFQPGENLGWEGGLNYAVERTDEDFVMFLNDDTFIPQSSSHWLVKMLNFFHDEKVGAVGPSSNVVMGNQNIFNIVNPYQYVNYLIFFCVLIRRKALIDAGGIDESLPGGDDIDLSIRLRKAGYKLVCDKSVFVYHHGFKTGERIHGTPDKPFGWNSYEFKERTDFALIRKHGFRVWYETLFTPCKYQEDKPKDLEGDMIREMKPAGKIIDLGCGSNKTIEDSIGVDIIPKGEKIDSLNNAISVADVVADVSKPLPFDKESIDVIIARHILEHMTDTIEVLKNWKEVLKKKGRLIIAVPDEEIVRSIPMNLEHKHAFTKKSLSTLLEMVGFKVIDVKDLKKWYVIKFSK